MRIANRDWGSQVFLLVLGVGKLFHVKKLFFLLFELIYVKKSFSFSSNTWLSKTFFIHHLYLNSHESFRFQKANENLHATSNSNLHVSTGYYT